MVLIGTRNGQLHSHILITQQAVPWAFMNQAIALAQLTGAELVALKVIPRYPQTYFEGGVALAAAEIGKIVRKEGVGGLVVGLPLSMNGSFGPAAQAARDWAGKGAA